MHLKTLIRTPSISFENKFSAAIIGSSRRRHVFRTRPRYVYLVVIDESSGQVTTTRKAQRGARTAFPILRNPRLYRCHGACVLISPTRCQPIAYPTEDGRPSFAHARCSVPLPRTRRLLLSPSRSQLLSRRGMVLFSRNGTFLFEHRLIRQPIGRAAL